MPEVFLAAMSKSAHVDQGGKFLKRFVKKAEVSQEKLTNSFTPGIIKAASGMCEVGLRTSPKQLKTGKKNSRKSTERRCPMLFVDVIAGEARKLPGRFHLPWKKIGLAMIVLIVAAGLAVGARIMFSAFTGGAAPTVQTSEQTGEVSISLDSAPAQAGEETVADTIPLVQGEVRNLGFNPSTWVGNLSEWLIVTENGLYVVNQYDYASWRLRDGTWEELGQAQYKESHFQIGDLRIPAELGLYAGIFLPAYEVSYEAERKEVFASISPSYGGEVIILARDPADRALVAALTWEYGGRLESGAPAPPIPHLYLTTDNQQSWVEIELIGLEKRDPMHPFNGLAVKQDKEGATHLFITNGRKGIWQIVAP